jgi:hypothetical protein
MGSYAFRELEMMAEAAATEKQVKREARQLRDVARAAFALGNYGKARELDIKIVRLVPDSDLGREAAREAQNLRTDPWAIYIGLGALAIYGLGWLVGLT